MPRVRPKKPIGSDWMPIESIKGVPNVLTSSVTLHRWKQSYQEKGANVPKKRPCLFCGRWFRSYRSLAVHLTHCDKRKTYYRMIDHGWTFHIGDKSFVLRSDCWGYIREAVSLEERLNDDITAGRLSEDLAIQMFYIHIRAHLASWHNPRTGIVSVPWDPSPAETGPGPATAAES